eukprot:CAMPEP_0203922480 /NCGR_PEP_ID=MMETSP0359-20131031/62503_1 /ASSEMBLY_ACC=CAM_ASM_000338 /TAXON_ID=268821 /ORGANISM="Scrippsiella Hangoei, Strain SHTV-5" /LENGTH=150 /DNA_ID=CAMNT_0050850377 /DNA_START=40 /DNA_END=488 /DNA_ORIENTATION=+
MAAPEGPPVGEMFLDCLKSPASLVEAVRRGGGSPDFSLVVERSSSLMSQQTLAGEMMDVLSSVLRRRCEAPSEVGAADRAREGPGTEGRPWSASANSPSCPEHWAGSWERGWSLASPGESLLGSPSGSAAAGRSPPPESASPRPPRHEAR